MLTGFNTDISHEGVVYHVQTEDKGPENPMLLSLIYVRGEILAAKRTYYGKDLEAGQTLDDIQKKLEKQHKAILALINRGRVNELIEMRAQSSSAHSAVPEPPPPPPPPPAFSGRPAGVTEFLSPLLLESLQQNEEPPPAPEASGQTPPPARPSAPMPGVTSMLDSVLRDVLHSSGGSLPAYSPSPTPVSQPQPTTGSTGKVSEVDLDRILSDYMHSEGDKPEIELLGNPSFFAGETIALQVRVTAGPQPRLLTNIPVVVKILGTAFKPQVHSTVTGADGVAVFTITLPQFAAGSAALVIQATSEIGETEVKQLIRRR